MSIIMINAEKVRQEKSMELLARYLRTAIHKLGADTVAKIVASEFRGTGHPKHLRRHL